MELKKEILQYLYNNNKDYQLIDLANFLSELQSELSNIRETLLRMGQGKDNEELIQHSGQPVALLTGYIDRIPQTLENNKIMARLTSKGEEYYKNNYVSPKAFIKADNLHIGNNYGNYSQTILPIPSSSPKDSKVDSKVAISAIIQKWWWIIVVPIIIGIILLVIEYKYFNKS